MDGIRSRLTLIGSVALMVAPVGCALRSYEPIGRCAAIQQPDRFVVLFVVDGLSRDVFDRMIAHGELPHMDRRFVQAGVAVDRAIASLPPITYPNTVSLLTGRFPGHHGILGNQWFDRTTLRRQDYGSAATYTDVNDDFRAPTIYEILADQFTVSIQNHTRRGVTAKLDSRVAAGIDWCLHRFARVDRRVGTRFGRVIELSRRERQWPVLTTLYFPGLDEIGHRFGPDSQPYRTSLRVIDEAIGSVFARLEAEALADRAYSILVSDHGLVAHGAARTVDAVDWLRRRLGWRIRHDGKLSKSRRRRLAQLDPYDAVVINGAFRRLSIHLRGAHGWADPPDADRIAALLPTRRDPAGRPDGLLALPGVAWICVRMSPNRVYLYARRGTAVVERRVEKGTALYRLMDPDHLLSTALPLRGDRSGDAVAPRPPRRAAATSSSGPLVRESDALVRESFLAPESTRASDWRSSRDWLSATAHAEFPDFVPQIMEMFDSPRAGDVVVFADKDWSFAKVRGGHGSCLAQDMVVPLYFAGPGLPAGGRIEMARTVDVMPTILDLLGTLDRLTEIEPIDGISLVPLLKEAGTHGGNLPQEGPMGDRTRAPAPT